MSMITWANLDGCPPRIQQDMQELSRAWPVGARVRHVSGWTGRVAVDKPGNPLTITDGVGAHAIVVPPGTDNVAVCVTHEIDGKPVTAWYRPSVLTLPSEAGPRTRTRVVRHVGRAA